MNAFKIYVVTSFKVEMMLVLENMLVLKGKELHWRIQL